MDHAFTVSVPRLQSKRLVLREYRREDFDAFADHLSNAESAAHLGLSDRQKAWQIFNSQCGLWLLQGAGWWSVALRESGQLVGNVGAFFREGSTLMEIGWNTYREFWGQGIASEAAAAVLTHAFEIRREPKVQALIAPGNDSSLRVAQRLGLTYETETEIHGQRIGSYVRKRQF